MTALIVARTSLTRYLRDRTALFFVVALPVMVILLVGVTLRGFDELRVATVDLRSGVLGAELTESLDASPAMRVKHTSTIEAARTMVRRGEADVAVLIPPGTDTTLRHGGQVRITVFADRSNATQQAALSAVASVVGTESGRIQAAQFAQSRSGRPFASALARARALEAASTPVSVRTISVDATRNFLPEGFSYSAPTMLVLFVFINALAAGGSIIENRRIRMYERMLAAPVRVRSIVAGETLCYLVLALIQSVIIVSVGGLFFGVNWGDPLAATALIAAWALVGTGAGVLSGTLFRTPEQAAAIGPPIGIVLGMLGGCMWPLEIVPDAMRTLGHLSPHAWAVDAWTGLLSRGDSLSDIARPLVMLCAFALALLALATVRLRRAVVS